ncbi:hypothetical protein [Mucilaginibacter gossypii]|uniref:Uncharacterized protein n=1 Tax=Mucilaginibacter gossypii TaxID=551996 RepID=A0A1G8N437_9SPHI|nr:hypothetical protein [Mucilaginibacter gossypii]SDI74952.1 hypothetical protein SAMN05192573_1318 [Mucilaginibacter gossypii]
MQKTIQILFPVILCMLFSCKKDRQSAPATIPPITSGSNTLYSDSIFFVQASDNNVKSLLSSKGKFSSLPDGLSFNENTGEINVNSSETGLRYKVTFTPNDGGAPQTSTIIISGINYQDKIYNLSQGDSIAVPIYNANPKLTLPGTDGSNLFDQNGGCKKAGIDVNNRDGIINLALSVRNQGIDTGATQQVKLAYRLNDASKNSLNGLEVKIYFYRTANEIPQYLLDLLTARKMQMLGAVASQTNQQSNVVTLSSIAFNVKRPVKARPPCIIVVSR